MHGNYQHVNQDSISIPSSAWTHESEFPCVWLLVCLEFKSSAKFCIFQSIQCFSERSKNQHLMTVLLNTLKPIQNDFGGQNHIIFWYKMCCMFSTIPLKFISTGPMNYKLSLVQILDWYTIGDEPLSQLIVTKFCHSCTCRNYMELICEVFGTSGTIRLAMFVTNSRVGYSSPVGCSSSKKCSSKCSF